MKENMWRLSDFRYDEAIPGEEVWLLDDAVESSLVKVAKTEALARTRARGLRLFAEWPQPDDDGVWHCSIGRVDEPLRWEVYPAADPVVEVDPNLWFEVPADPATSSCKAVGTRFAGA